MPVTAALPIADGATPIRSKLLAGVLDALSPADRIALLRALQHIFSLIGETA
jgi:hypothetical protein